MYSNRSVFDMAHFLPDDVPPVYANGWANRAWVQEELGVKINFTGDSYVSQALFTGVTGDIFRRAGLKDIEYLLDSGIKVSLIYGDRDYRCPWLGVEQLSLAANWTGAKEYREAGYEEIRVNDSYVGGVVKQHGGLSFSRVFNAGHDVAYFQPETVAKIAARSMSGHDVATGRVVVDSSLSTHGPLSSWGWRNKAPVSPPHECYIWSTTSCTLDQVSLPTSICAFCEGKLSVCMKQRSLAPKGNSPTQTCSDANAINSMKQWSTALRKSKTSLSPSLYPAVDLLAWLAASPSSGMPSHRRDM